MHLATWLTARLAVAYVGGWPLILRAFTVLAVVFVASAAIELVAVGWRSSALGRLVRGGRSARTDVVTALVLQLPLAGHLGIAMSCGLSLAMIKFATHLAPWWPAGQWPWLHRLAMVVLIDFLSYGVHRCQHEIPALWALHRFHHSATEATLLNALREHPLERTLNGMVLAVPLALLGGRPDDMIVVFLVLQVLSMLRHSNLTSHWGWLGKHVLVSPACHNAHHAADPAYHDRNFGVLFVFWDRFFGTWKAPAAEPSPIGLPGDPLETAGWARGVWIGYRDCLLALGPWRRSPAPPLERPLERPAVPAVAAWRSPREDQRAA